MLVKINEDIRVKDSVKELTVPTLTHCVHECIWYLQQNCSGITYQREKQFCTISNSTELMSSPYPVDTYLWKSKLNGELLFINSVGDGCLVKY